MNHLPNDIRISNLVEVLEDAKVEAKEFMLRPAEVDFMETPDKAVYFFHLTSYVEAINKIRGLERSKALVQYYDPTFSTEAFDQEIKELMNQLSVHSNMLQLIIEKVRG